MYIMFDYILFVLLWLFAITLIVFLSYKLKRLAEKYKTLKKMYFDVKTENIKLHHEVYRLTFILPEENNEKKGK